MVLTLKQDRVIVKTERDLDKLESKVNQILRESEAFSILELTTIINKEIIEYIQDEMSQIPVSTKIIDSTFLSSEVLISGNIAIFRVMSTFISDTGFPVSVMIEEGRDPYTVEAGSPTEKRPNPHLRYIKEGKVNYAKKVNIPIYPARQIIKNTIKDRTKIVQKQYNKSARKWVKSILRG